MNENIIMVEEITETAEEMNKPCANSRFGFVKWIAAGTAVVAGVVVFLKKTEEKREHRTIEKLKKKGYVIYMSDEVEVVDAEVEEA